jgi:Domain of unknown function (DU1801)
LAPLLLRADVQSRKPLTLAMPFKRHVTLGFYYGGELPDPGGLLPESGGRQVAGKLAMRSLKIASIGDVSRPELRSLMEAAVRHRVPPPSG